jgi:short-subunit dehydrogenase
MKRTLSGRRALITGASSGIGRALAVEAARAGMRLAVAARSRDRLAELARELGAAGAEVLTVPADVTVPDDRRRLLQVAADRFGGLDVLVNNAGLGTQGPFAESTEQRLRQVMEVNFFAPAELTRLAVPLLTRGEQPAVVNVASMTGRRAMPLWAEYSASKFALCGLSEALRAELVRYGIDVVLIVPGLTRTGLPANLLASNGRLVANFARGMPPESVARSVLAALRANRAETVLGWEARWMLRANRFLPRLLNRLLARKMRQLYPPQA